MLTSLTDQINAIQHARAYFKNPRTADIDAALNDAASTIQAVKLGKHLEQKDNAVEVAMTISKGIFYDLEKLYS